MTEISAPVSTLNCTGFRSMCNNTPLERIIRINSSKEKLLNVSSPSRHYLSHIPANHSKMACFMAFGTFLPSGGANFILFVYPITSGTWLNRLSILGILLTQNLVSFLSMYFTQVLGISLARNLIFNELGLACHLNRDIKI